MLKRLRGTSQGWVARALPPWPRARAGGPREENVLVNLDPLPLREWSPWVWNAQGQPHAIRDKPLLRGWPQKRPHLPHLDQAPTALRMLISRGWGLIPSQYHKNDSKFRRRQESGIWPERSFKGPVPGHPLVGLQLGWGWTPGGSLQRSASRDLDPKCHLDSQHRA